MAPSLYWREGQDGWEQDIELLLDRQGPHMQERLRGRCYVEIPDLVPQHEVNREGEGADYLAGYRCCFH
ncbi:hypothetical protein D9M69_505490 [compost metagenome]